MPGAGGAAALPLAERAAHQPAHRHRRRRCPTPAPAMPPGFAAATLHRVGGLELRVLAHPVAEDAQLRALVDRRPRPPPAARRSR